MDGKCPLCAKRVSSADEYCPHCGMRMGASSSTPKEVEERFDPGPPPPYPPCEQWDDTIPQSPPPAPPQYYYYPGNSKRKAGLLVFALFILLVILINIPTAFVDYDDGDDWDAPVYQGSGEFWELYDGPEYCAEDVAYIYDEVKRLYGNGLTDSGLSAAMGATEVGYDGTALYRALADYMLELEDNEGAVRMYLFAWGVAGDDLDLNKAMEIAPPVEIAGTGPVRQAIELAMGKPMSQVTWEEIREIRGLEISGDTVQVNMPDRSSASGTEYMDAMQVVPTDGGEVSVFYLYGLQELVLDVSVYNPERLGLQGMRELRSLHIKSIDAEDLGVLRGIKSLEQLWVGGKNLHSLYGLEELPRLRSLALSQTAVDNLYELLPLERLEELVLYRNDDITSIEVLVDLPLRSLTFYGGNIGDYHLLAQIEGLEELSILNTDIKEASYLPGMTSLRLLELCGNSSLKSVSGIGNLSNLEHLAVSAGDVGGIQEISQLTGLTALSLVDATDLGMLSSLTALAKLELCGGTQLDDLLPLSGLAALETLVIRPGGYHSSRVNETYTGSLSNYSYYFTLEPLAGLENLRHVELPYASIYGDCDSLLNLPALEYLDVTGSALNIDATGFVNLQSLQTLKASKFRALYDVWVRTDGFYTEIGYETAQGDGLTPYLAGLTQLRHLEIAKSEVSDLSFAASLQALSYLDVSGNYITDPSPLAGCPSLSYVDLSENPVYDWSSIESNRDIVVEGR